MNAENNQTNEFITYDCEKFYKETTFTYNLPIFSKVPFNRD